MYEKENFAVIPHAGSLWLCLKYQTTYTNQPILITHYWPFRVVSSYELNGPLEGIDGAPARKCDTANYSWRTRWGSWEDFRLIDGGQTKPIKTTEEPLLCPKTRCETRFYMGAWQKYLKAKGWVPA